MVKNTPTLLKTFTQIISPRFDSKSGSVKVSRGVSDVHELAKFLLFLESKEHEIVTEAIFKNGCRADVFDLTTCVALEVLRSETKKSFREKKANRYPVQVYAFYAEDVILTNLRALLPGWKIERPEKQ